MLGLPARKRIHDRIRRLFGGMPCRVQVAALPWRAGENGLEVMLITSRGTGRWVLPKGWPEGSEPLCEAARREAAEEAGLSGKILPSEAGSFYYRKARDSGEQWLCEVRVFPMQVTGVAEKWPEEKSRKRRWFSPQVAGRLVAEPDLGALIRTFQAPATNEVAA
nr:NUDIX hydrolase [Oryzicola mucosus]